MISPRKLAANRLNALKSTGPRTDAGKARSAQNSARHGLLARVPVLVALGENQQDWKTFRRAVIRDFDPHGEVEFCLAELAAQLLWQLGRAAKFGAAAAAVGFLPAAALTYADGLGPDGTDREPDPDGRVAQLRAAADRAARARDAARVAAELVRRADVAGGTDSIDPAVVEAAWRAGCQACRWHPDYFAEERAAEFLARIGVPQEERYARSYQGWDATRLRDGLTHLTELAGLPAAEVTAATAGRLDRDARDWGKKLSALERELARAAGELAASAVRADLERARPGGEALELCGRYQVRLGVELERVLRLLESLKAARPAGGAGEASEG